MSMNDFEGYTEHNAQVLPDGWKWRDFEDGSGSLRSPNGKRYVQYDLSTKEYRYKGEQWQFFMGYPYGTEYLESVKERVEFNVRDMLAKENVAPDYSRKHTKATKNNEAR